MDQQTKCFKIIFEGKIIQGQDSEKVRSNLATLFKVKPDQINNFFTGKPIVLKNNLTDETALKYKQAINNAGADCFIEPIYPISNVTDINIPAKTDFPKQSTQNKIIQKVKLSANISRHIFIIIGIFFTSFVLSATGTLININLSYLMPVLMKTVSGGIFVTAVYFIVAWIIKRKTQ